MPKGTEESSSNESTHLKSILGKLLSHVTHVVCGLPGCN